MVFTIRSKCAPILTIIQSRLVYCKTRVAPTTATIGHVGFRSKQWIGCHPNHSVAYKAKVGVRGTLGPTRAEIAQLVPKFRSGPDRIYHMWP